MTEEDILQPDIFPITCNNPDCLSIYSISKFITLIENRGILFADCGEVIFQGFSCQACNRPMIFRCARTHPIISLSSFILQPPLKEWTNLYEQAYLDQHNHQNEPNLNYDLIPALKKGLPYPEKVKLHGYGFSDSNLFFTNETLVKSRYHNTYNLEISGFRKLFVNNTYWKHLLTLSSPRQYNMICMGKHAFDGVSEQEINSIIEAILFFAEINNRDLKEQVIQELNILRINFNEKKYDKRVKRILKEPEFDLIDNQNIFHNLIRNDFDRTNFIWEGWEPYFNMLVTKSLRTLSLDEPRKKLKEWPKRVKRDQALLVDAPMGLGKSTSIIDTLTENQDKSAVIFLPTKKLCLEMARKIREKIALKRGKKDLFSKNNESGTINSLSNSYLNHEIFFNEGINKDDCIHFDEIIEKYGKFSYSKSQYCNHCKKHEAKACRFIEWQDKARISRIVVTTHKQYDLFNAEQSLHEYFLPNIHNKPQKRDYFLIDEDLIISNCYTPYTLTHKTVKIFADKFGQFLKIEFPNDPQNADIINKIDLLFGKIHKPEKTAVIAPIDTNFTISKAVREKWQKIYSDLHEYEPDYTDTTYGISPANLIDIIEHGIRCGVVVQRYTKIDNRQDSGYKRVNQIFFPNPKYYDLSNCPPHVFFNGTQLNKTLLKFKIKGVKFHQFDDFKENFPTFKHTIYQNENSDLSTTKIDEDKDKVIEMLNGLLQKHGKKGKYFIHTTKSIYDNYLMRFVNSKSSEYSIICKYYGNLRSDNVGENCNIHIMLGSFIPPDALEIAMGLELIQDKLDGKEVHSTRNNFWTFSGSNSKRRYKQEFAILNDLAEIFRFSEHRQALARSRYISHPVTFYIISKDPLSEWEPYLKEYDRFSFAEEFFPPKTRYRETKYNEVKSAILYYFSSKKYLEKHNKPKACDTDIHKNFKINRATVKKHREKLMEEGFIRWFSKTSKTYYTIS